MNTVKVNDIEIFQISDVDLKLLDYDLLEIDKEINQRLQYIIEHKSKQCFQRMKAEWVDSGKLESLGVTSIPTNRDELVNLITLRPEYKNRAERDLLNVIV